jgi:hypothetical protein
MKFDTIGLWGAEKYTPATGFRIFEPRRLRPKEDDDVAPPSFTDLTLIAQATLPSDHLAIPRTIPFSSLSKILPKAFFDFHQNLGSPNAPAVPTPRLEKGIVYYNHSNMEFLKLFVVAKYRGYYFTVICGQWC